MHKCDLQRCYVRGSAVVKKAGKQLWLGNNYGNTQHPNKLVYSTPLVNTGLRAEER